MQTDIRTRQAFKAAIFEITETNFPTRSELKEIGCRAAKIVGRNHPWGASHLYTLLHWDRWPKYNINPKLVKAVLRMASMEEALNGKRHVDVIADHVRPGAVVLLPSRKCARRRCRVHFVGLSRYCSTSCRTRTQASRRKRRIEARRREKHGRHSRRTTHSTRAA
jgi:hypothetical protein